VAPTVTGSDMVAALGDAETSMLVYDLHNVHARGGRDQGLAVANMRRPVVPEQAGPTMEADPLDRLVKACSEAGFDDRRDLAMVMGNNASGNGS
jgi:hypothetical protein